MKTTKSVIFGLAIVFGLGILAGQKATAQEWEIVTNIPIGEILGDSRIQGVAFDGEFFYVAGSNDEDTNLVYVLDRDFELIRSFPQPGESRYGMNDLEWDGELLWGSGEEQIFGFDTDGNVVTEFQGTHNPTQRIAWDPEREVLWLSGVTTNIVAYDRAGNRVGEPLSRGDLRIYGLAYMPDDWDVSPLYVFGSISSGPHDAYKLNPQTGESRLAFDVPELPDGAHIEGAYICNNLRRDAWSTIMIWNMAGGDRLVILETQGLLRWIDLPDEVAGNEMEMIEFDVRGESANQGDELTLTCASEDLPEDVFEDNGGGEGVFFWQPSYFEAGEYTATFTLSNGVDELRSDVEIIVANVNRPPAQVALSEPADRSPIPENQLVRFSWFASQDEDLEDLTYLLRIVGSDDFLTYDAGSDTTIEVERRDLIWLLTGESLSWEVFVIDAEDTVGTESPYTLLPPLGLGQELHSPVFLNLTTFPNPFNSTATIRFDLPNAGDVSLKVIDLAGRDIASLAEGNHAAGSRSVAWEATNQPGGIYLVRLSTPEGVRTSKVTLIR